MGVQEHGHHNTMISLPIFRRHWLQLRKEVIRILPAAMIGEYAHHVPREHNKEADALANSCLDEQRDMVHVPDHELLKVRWPYIWMACDGASRGNPGNASMGICIKGRQVSSDIWHTIIHISTQLGQVNSMQAELTAMAHTVIWGIMVAKGTFSIEDMKVMDMLCPW